MAERKRSKKNMQPNKQGTQFLRHEDDFATLYANNVTLEANAMDLKMVFGEIDLGKQLVEQHTSVTIPWVQAKIIAYYLAVFIAQQEAVNGKIRIPAGVLPDLVAVPDDAPPALRPVFEMAQTLHHKLVEDIATP